MGLARFFCSADDKKLYRSYTGSAEQVTVSEFSAFDQLGIEFTLLQRSSAGNAGQPFSRVNPALYQLRMGLFLASDRTQLAYQNVFADDASDVKKTGTLALDTAAITSALAGAVTSVQTIFEIQVVDASGRVQNAYRNNAVTLIEPLITTGTLTVPPTEQAATVSFVRGFAVPRIGTEDNPSSEFTMLSTPGALKYLVTISDAGQFQATLIP